MKKSDMGKIKIFGDFEKFKSEFYKEVVDNSSYTRAFKRNGFIIMDGDDGCWCSSTPKVCNVL